MFKLNRLVRPNISKMTAYSCARNEYDQKEGILLDANENPFGSLNRYPDPDQSLLKESLSKLKGVPFNNIFIGNGSDEVIDLVFRIFCEPGFDKAITVTPSYGMYKVCADINNIELIKIPLDKNFNLDKAGIIDAFIGQGVKLLILCSPNNPTGNSFNKSVIRDLLVSFEGIVLIDEAYIDFSAGKSWLNELDDYPNLIVCQTFSKAMGLASARVGSAYASKEIIDLFKKVKHPYNVSTANQLTALKALNQRGFQEKMITIILKQREILIKELKRIEIVKKIYPTDSNFILLEIENSKEVYKKLVAENIIVRDRSSLVENSLRITIGTPFENRQLIKCLKKISDHTCHELTDMNRSRRSQVYRKTNETVIYTEINLDGKGEALIDTGIGFFDHMLMQIAAHGNIDIYISAEGDLAVDEHHTIEDVAIALGEAFKNALGEKRGIKRYGFVLPMDDSLAQVAIDFGGRPWLVWNADFKREMIGDTPSEMFIHFFKSFSDTALCNLNISCTGINEHHMIESIFKAFARSLKMAVADTGEETVPSTKGSL